jgi:DNA helicase HerA-like ATPase
VLCSLEAWRVTQIPRPARRQPPGQPPGGPDADDGDLLAGQRAAVLGAAYHGGTGPVGFAWVRDRTGGPVQVVAAGRALATMVRATSAGTTSAGATSARGTSAGTGDQDVALKLPAGGRGQALDPGGLARMLTTLPYWVQIAGVADSLLATQTPAPSPAGAGRAVSPSLEDGLLAAWPGPFAWLVLAEPAGRAELEELTFGVYAAQGAAQRFDNPQAQLSVRRLQDRHAELRQAASAGLWRVRLLAGAAGGPEAAEVAGLLCASADLAGLPYGLVPVPGCGRLDRVLTTVKTTPGGLDTDGGPEPASPFYGSSAVLAALARPPAREIPGSARFVLRPEFDTIPETGAGPGAGTTTGTGTTTKTATDEPGLTLGQLLDRDRLPAGPLTLPRASLNRHTFVCGATGAGKSQTVRHLLEQAAKAGIPWLVIEPAKAEYSQGLAARLAGHAEVIRIRPGEAGQAAAGLNPLEPAAGADGSRFPLQTHADLAKSLFLAAFEADEPFPQVLNAALIRAYDEHGWDLVLGEPKTPGVQPGYPTLEDLQAAADHVVREAAYGAEVERNVRGFITVRLGSLRLGTPGRFFEGGHPLDFTALLDRNVVLEIEDVGDDQDKAFLIGAVLIRLTEHLRLRQRNREPGPQPLRHLTVLEEAHRLLRDPGPGQRGPAAKAVELFASLFAEVRAYGEGLVVAEQIPSKLISDVTKNTAVKIVHRLPAADDRQAVGATMNLTPAQEQYIVTLPPGEAAVFADGADYPWLVRMPDGTGREAAPDVATPPAAIITPRSASCGPDCQGAPCTLRQLRRARRAAGDDPRITWWAELTVLAHLAGWAMPFPGPEFTADLRALATRQRDCALGQAVDDAVAARAAVITARVSPGPLAVHVVTAMRHAVTGGTWPCDREEPPYLAPSYQWVLVLEALQAACRDGLDGRHPRSAEWERAYGRGIPGPDGASQLAAVTRWHAAAQRDPRQLHAVAWGRRPDPALERAAGAKAGDHDWTERVACHLDAFVQPCRWPLDYLTSPASAQPQE